MCTCLCAATEPPCPRSVLDPTPEASANRGVVLQVVPTEKDWSRNLTRPLPKYMMSVLVDPVQVNRRMMRKDTDIRGEVPCLYMHVSFIDLLQADGRISCLS